MGSLDASEHERAVAFLRHIAEPRAAALLTQIDDAFVEVRGGGARGAGDVAHADGFVKEGDDEVSAASSCYEASASCVRLCGRDERLARLLAQQVDALEKRVTALLAPQILAVDSVEV